MAITTAPAPASPVSEAAVRPGALARIRHWITEIRRLPLFPVTMLLVFLLIPAVFAELIAPHNPRRGDLDDRLVPPAWSGDVVSFRTVVERVNRDNRQNEIKLTDAERTVRIGDATVVGKAEGEAPVLGDQIQIVVKPGGQGKYLLGTDKKRHGHIQSHCSRRPAGAGGVDDGDLRVGADRHGAGHPGRLLRRLGGHAGDAPGRHVTVDLADPGGAGAGGHPGATH